MEADTWTEISIADVGSFVAVTGPAAPPPLVSATTVVVASSSPLDPGFIQVATASTADPNTVFVSVVRDYLAALHENDRADLVQAITGGTGSIPSDHHGRVLARAGAALGASLDTNQKRALRGEIKRQLGIS